MVRPRRCNLIGVQSDSSQAGIVTERINNTLLDRGVDVYRQASLHPSSPLSCPPRTPLVFVDELGKNFPLHDIRAGAFFVTWFNSSKISTHIVDYINEKSISLIVPSEYCLTVLSASGVITPLYQIPFGVDKCSPPLRDSEVEPPIYILANVYDKPEYIDTLARALEEHGLLSKGSVQLLVQLGPGIQCNFKYIGVSILPSNIPKSYMETLYEQCDFYVSFERLAWDTDMLNAMCHGVIPIGLRFAGNLEFLDSDVGIPIPFSYVNNSELTAVPDATALSSVFGPLIDINMNRTSIFNRAQDYTWSEFGRRLLDVVR